VPAGNNFVAISTGFWNGLAIQVPEPASWALAAIGFGGVAVFGWWRKRFK
jgi:hypothetical protein